MELIGMLDSPFVRRVAITARFLGIEYEHNPLSIFKNYDEFRKINPLVKVPDQRSQYPGLGLASQAEQNKIVLGQQSVDDSGNDRSLVSQHAGEQPLGIDQTSPQIIPDLALDRPATPAADR